MGRYEIDFGTGAGNEYADSENEAMDIAREGMAYTQTDIVITDSLTGKKIISKWWSVSPTEEDDVLQKFGDFGFYQNWVMI